MPATSCNGISGIAATYYLVVNHGVTDVVLIDAGQPMAFTSAQSGENYRNWWPRPEMVTFTDRSIDLMQAIARDSGNRINMNRRGYALATRRGNIDGLLQKLHTGLGQSTQYLLRLHDTAWPASYRPPINADWQTAPAGIDILQDQTLIRRTFPSCDPEVQNVVHIRRGGDISGHQLGMYMLETIRQAGGRRLTGTVQSITHGNWFALEVATPGGTVTVRAEKIVNAAGPFADRVAAMLGVDLPLHNTFQQKIAFEDKAGVIPRCMPFSIDLDRQQIDWQDEDRKLLLQKPGLRWLAEDMPGAIHCRPDGGDRGKWPKLGWAYNRTPATATLSPPLDDAFPEAVPRGAARLNPSLKAYYGRLPRNTRHYGGWYTMTPENWPLIGEMGPEGAYMSCAYSGFGTMAACAGGELCAAWIAGAELPGYGRGFSLQRYRDTALMQQLHGSNRGLL